jgi:hypothetical protein
MLVYQRVIRRDTVDGCEILRQLVQDCATIHSMKYVVMKGI